MNLLTINQIFEENISWELGQRLGVSFLQSHQDEVPININGRVITLQQSSLGVVAITGVVWDAGLLMVDFLSWICSDRCELSFHEEASDNITFFKEFLMWRDDHKVYELGNTLDLGCGTGVAGISSLYLNAREVVLSDHRCCCLDNINDVQEDKKCFIKFLEYDWNKAIPNELAYCNSSEMSMMIWDTVLCSDVVYENKALEPLLIVLSELRFRRLIISYKRRHDDQEKSFFDRLTEFCHVRAITPKDIPLLNLKEAQTRGLYIILAIKK